MYPHVGSHWCDLSDYTHPWPKSTNKPPRVCVLSFEARVGRNDVTRSRIFTSVDADKIVFFHKRCSEPDFEKCRLTHVARSATLVADVITDCVTCCCICFLFNRVNASDRDPALLVQTRRRWAKSATSWRTASPTSSHVSSRLNGSAANPRRASNAWLPSRRRYAAPAGDEPTSRGRGFEWPTGHFGTN